MSSAKEEQWRTDGLFWADDDPNHSLHGTLVMYWDGRSDLLLRGILEAPQNGPIGERVNHQFVIRGETEKYRSISMLHAIETNRHMSFRGLDRCVYTARRTIASYAAHCWEDLEVLKFKASLDALDSWLGISGFKIDQNIETHTIAVGYKLPDCLTFRLNSLFSVEFNFSLDGLSHRYFQSEVTMKQKTYLSSVSNSPQPLEQHMRIAQSVADLICLGIGEAMTFSPSEGKFAVPSTAANGTWADLFIVMNPSSEADAPDAFNMLFNFREVASRFAGMLEEWIRNSELVSATYQLYFATIRSSQMYVEHRLFNFFQALESFHRKKYGDTLYSAQIHSRSVSAGERITDLVERFSADWIFVAPWRETLAEIVKVRNYLVHNERKPAESSMTSLAILNAGSRLQMLCEIVLLSQAGFTEQEANNQLKSKNRASRLIYR